jgi:hypothetical protein
MALRGPIQVAFPLSLNRREKGRDLDATVSRRVSSRVDLFVAAENLINERYEIGKTPVTTIGPPILVRVGFRLRLGDK